MGSSHVVSQFLSSPCVPNTVVSPSVVAVNLADYVPVSNLSLAALPIPYYHLYGLGQGISHTSIPILALSVASCSTSLRYASLDNTSDGAHPGSCLSSNNIVLKSDIYINITIIIYVEPFNQGALVSKPMVMAHHPWKARQSIKL
jgi:hypothetical protein